MQLTGVVLAKQEAVQQADELDILAADQRLSSQLVRSQYVQLNSNERLKCLRSMPLADGRSHGAGKRIAPVLNSEERLH